jgi:hypothetical protein
MYSELSGLATKWENEMPRGFFDRLLNKGKGPDAVRALGEGIKNSLDKFQVCVE